MMKKLVAGVSLILSTAPMAVAAEPGCTQALLEGKGPPLTKSFITPRDPVQPFYEWYNNNGYCGEVSLLQAGLNFGQWMSQFNARLICGSGLSQTGPDGFCAANQQTPNFNAQLLLESPLPGDAPYADAEMCLANARLNAKGFDHRRQAAGIPGYQQYMSWIKGELISGNQVAIAVMHFGDTGTEYDHIVTVSQIGTNHSVFDPSYYDDDVLYFEDHGSLTIVGNQLSPDHPSVPMGAVAAEGCNPFYFGYTFGSLPNTRAGANQTGAQRYSIIIPGVYPTVTQTGGDGVNPNPTPITGGNYAFSVAGPLDDQNVTLPVNLKIVASSAPNGAPNPPDPIAGYDYEAPMIGSDVLGNECTNVPPTQWMELTLSVTVSGLHVGKTYNLYKYEFDHVSGVGASAALAVPSSDFNAHKDQATEVTRFVALASTYMRTIQTSSDKIVVFRAVPADAP